MLRTRNFYLCLLISSFFSFQAKSQEVRLELGTTEISLNQYFTITLTVENERLKNYSPFPEIEGFVKRGTSSSTSTSFINGQMTSSQSITQNYQAINEGSYSLPPFTMTVNGADVAMDGATIRVGPASQQRRPPSNDPFQNFFNRGEEPTEFIDVEADAFLALTTDKSEVYVGEGFTTTIAFYVAETNRADMRFFDLGKQITEIVKKIKPANTWEENFNIDNINGVPVTINNRAYTQYKIYQAAFYPLNVEDLAFPSISLKLIKYKVAKNPSFFGRNRQEDYETFYSKPRTVTVKQLPPHPLRESVAVGDYRLAEQINTLEVNTGQSFNYTFNIIGEGNVSAIEAPVLPATEYFDFYAPNVKQNVTRSNGKVKGTKSFTYYAIPNEPGEYSLGDYMKWIYFNPEKERYDTLRSQQVLLVSGESRKNEYIMSNDMGSFYDKIEFQKNNLQTLGDLPWIRIFANIFILTMISLTVIVLIRK